MSTGSKPLASNITQVTFRTGTKYSGSATVNGHPKLQQKIRHDVCLTKGSKETAEELGQVDFRVRVRTEQCLDAGVDRVIKRPGFSQLGLCCSCKDKEKLSLTNRI